MRDGQALQLRGARALAGIQLRRRTRALRIPTGPGEPFINARHHARCRLIQHEWTTHGTCSGLSADEYFGLIRKAFNSIKQPTQLTAAKTQQTLSPRQVKQAFEQANPNLDDSELMINCAGNYLQAVEVCLTKGLQPMTCPAPRDCRASTIRVPPIH